MNTSPRLVDQTEMLTLYTFKFMEIGNARFRISRPEWRTSKKRFPNLEEAVRAAGLWMQVCYDNDWPVAVQIVEAQ